MVNIKLNLSLLVLIVVFFIAVVPYSAAAAVLVEEDSTYDNSNCYTVVPLKDNEPYMFTGIIGPMSITRTIAQGQTN